MTFTDVANLPRFKFERLRKLQTQLRVEFEKFENVKVSESWGLKISNCIHIKGDKLRYFKFLYGLSSNMSNFFQNQGLQIRTCRVFNNKVNRIFQIFS